MYLTLVISQDTLIPSIKYTRYTYTHNIPLL
jgi:hypothetical protein